MQATAIAGPKSLSLRGKQTTQTLTAQFANFTKQTGIHVNMQVIPWSDLLQKILTAVTSGNGPDVMKVGNTWSPSFAASGGFLSFTPSVFSQIGGSAKFSKAALTVAGAPGKAPISVPVYSRAYELFYNKADFAAACVSSPPSTWTQFLADAKKLTTAGRYGVAIEGAAGHGRPFDIRQLTDVLSCKLQQHFQGKRREACQLRNGRTAMTPACPAQPRRQHIRLPREPASAAEARRLVRAIIRAWQVPVDPDIAVLLTSDLVTSLVASGTGPLIAMAVSCPETCLRIGASDTSWTPWPTEDLAVTAARPGLALIAALSPDWACYRTSAGPAAFFTLAFASAPERAAVPARSAARRPRHGRAAVTARCGSGPAGPQPFTAPAKIEEPPPRLDRTM